MSPRSEHRSITSGAAPAPNHDARRRISAFACLCLLILLAALIESAASSAAASPEVFAGTDTPESQTEVLLRGAVNPSGSEVTDCHFAWGPAAGGFEHEAPCNPSSPGSGTEPLNVTTTIASGLATGKIYHFKLVATNGIDTGESGVEPFAPFAEPQAEGACPNEARREEQHPEGSAATSLPECRAWEMVSPAQKNGGDVMAFAEHAQAAVSGDAMSYVSLTPFPGAEGSGVATAYVSERNGTPDTSGWSTHAISPLVDPLSFEGIATGTDTEYQGDFSADLSQGILRSYTPLIDDPNVAEVPNLYLRSDLLSPGPGSYRLLAACPVCTSPLADPEPRQYLAATTPDFGQVLFESSDRLTAEAPSVCSPLCLYETDRGTVRFLGILPNGSPASGSFAGAGGGVGVTTPNTISTDGSKVFFTVPTAGSEGALYMRLDHTSTVRLDASETEPSNPGRATDYTATPDGGMVFFGDPQQLTATPGGGIYVYDTTLPASDPEHLRHLFTDRQPADGTVTESRGVLGTSVDGSYVYFFVQSAILPGQPPLPSVAPIGLYVWHDGTITFIGSVNSESANRDALPASWVGSSFNSRLTPDGRSLLFGSYTGAGLTGYDHGVCNGRPCQELYLYRAETNQLLCVSCNPSGAPATSDAGADPRVARGGMQPSSHLNHPLSDDGRHVFFETDQRLVPEDTNGATDVYSYDVADGAFHLISTGTSPDRSHFLEATSDGSNIFFTTDQRLLGWDTDNSYDLYDARSGGGLAEPPPAEPSCEADTCRRLQPPPAASNPQSPTFVGPGNPKRPPGSRPKRCGRARHTKRGRGCHRHRHPANPKRSGR